MEVTNGHSPNRNRRSGGESSWVHTQEHPRLLLHIAPELWKNTGHRACLGGWTGGDGGGGGGGGGQNLGA